MAETIIGIDLGTTNSEVAAFVDGKTQILGKDDQLMLPSYVGISPNGELLIGQPAKNQMLLYPERTIRSVKRLMGTSEPIQLGDRTFTPPEISALILKELATRAQKRLGMPVSKAVITVPAYFSDAQRSDTRHAGELAGLEVVRIINEPTAASLAYGLDVAARQTVMIYDLGGGTLDVSIVRIEGEITEVLASHGNNRLGGDDFDQKLIDYLLQKFSELHHVDLRDSHPGAYARLWWAAEAAKMQLSSQPFARIREESLIQVDGKPLHLDVEVSQEQYEEMIRPLVEQTMDSASKAMSDAGVLPQALDAILLVGGSTRTPLVVKTLTRLCGKEPRQDLHPDLCVALGAGVLASRLGGHDVRQVLVDVSPYSFGPSYLGELNGLPSTNCYHPIIKRNTPLPITRTESYSTSVPYQNTVEILIYQGDDPDATHNILIGKFLIEGLAPMEEHNVVLCQMKLDLDGILHVTATEKLTGLRRHIAITGATTQRDQTAITKSRKALSALYESKVDEQTVEIEPRPLSEAQETTAGINAKPAQAMIERCRKHMDAMHADDREEALNLIEALNDAITANDTPALAAASDALKEFLFFIEGK